MDYIAIRMGGAKKQTLAQAEKQQSAEASKDEKKGKPKQGQMAKSTSFTQKINEAEANKVISQMKAITVYAAAKSLGVNAAMAQVFIKSSEAKGTLQKIGGYSGHYVYKYIGIK